MPSLFWATAGGGTSASRVDRSVTARARHSTPGASRAAMVAPSNDGASEKARERRAADASTSVCGASVSGGKDGATSPVGMPSPVRSRWASEPKAAAVTRGLPVIVSATSAAARRVVRSIPSIRSAGATHGAPISPGGDSYARNTSVTADPAAGGGRPPAVSSACPASLSTRASNSVTSMPPEPSASAASNIRRRTSGATRTPT
eukprot:scaffold1804_cov93-Isochrysis_galbana.AAC.2